MGLSQTRTIKGYELIDLIGEGVYGAVYRAHQPQVDREVAIKFILPRYANQPDFIRRFETEAQLVAQLEHLHIVPLYDYWRDPDGAYLVMRLMKGGSLEQSIHQLGPWGMKAATRLIDQIASALDAAHQKGVIHRDLKPANILLDEDGNAYLSDFGIAKAVGIHPEYTATGAIIGTPAYISPEQVQSTGVSAQTDIYAMGVTLFELLIGEHPFPDTPTAALILKHVNEPLPPIQDVNPDLPTEIDHVIQKATCKDPGARYENAISLAADFSLAAHPEIEIQEIQEGEIYNPYKGLRAFNEADAADFFGREALTSQLLERLAEEDSYARFLVVVGPSGSGKSSAVRAGLLPALRKGALPDSGDWFIVSMIPGPHPLEELEIALLRMAVNPNLKLYNQLQRDGRGLIRAARLVLPHEDNQLLLVIDQFEELFTLVEEPHEAQHFKDLITQAVTDPQSRVRVVITLRADFYDRPLSEPDFSTLVQKYTEVVVPMSSEELQDAIQCPAEKVGVTFESGLITDIVSDVVDQPGSLPMLQYSLTELFEQRDGRRLTREAYRVIGGVLAALGKRAEEIYTALDQPGKEAARQVFLRLVTLGEGVEDTRRRILHSELEALTPTPSPTNGRGGTGVREILDSFGRARLLSFDHDPLTRNPTVEVAHEALLREWPRLRDWLDESRADIRNQRVLSRAADDWFAADKDSSYLLRGARLDRFAGWTAETQLALTETEQEFMLTSLDAHMTRLAKEEARLEHEAALERHSRNFLRGLVAVMGIASIIAVLLSIFAFNQQREAQYNAATATIAQGQAQFEAATAVVAQEEAQQIAIAEAKAREEAEKSGRLSTANELVAFTLSELENLSDASHSLALLLAREAVLTTLRADGYITPKAEATLRLTIEETPIQVRRIQSQTNQPTRFVAWSPDGKHVLTGGETVQVWEVETGEETLAIDGFTGELTSASWSPDGQRILITSFGVKRISIWDAETGVEELAIQGVNLFRDSTYVSLSASWSPDGERFAAATENSVVIWDAHSGRELLRIPLERRTAMASFSTDGNWIAASEFARVIIFDARTGEEVVQLETNLPTSLHWSKDSSRLLTADGHGRAIIWDIQTGIALREFEQTRKWFWCAAWSPDESQIATVTAEGRIYIWESETGSELRQWQLSKDEIYTVDWSPDGTHIITAGKDGAARIWKMRGQTHLLHTNRVISADWNPNGSRILTTSGFNAQIWDARSEFELTRFDGHGSMVFSGAWEPNGERVITADGNGSVIIWNSTNGEVLGKFGDLTGAHRGAVYSMAWNPDGTLVLTAGQDWTARIWDVQSSEQIQTLEGHNRAVLAAAWSPDGSKIITASSDGTAMIWDSQSGIELITLQGHTKSVNDTDWSPDGKSVITASSDRTIRIWDVKNGEEIAQLVHTGPVLSVAWHPSGLQFVASGADGIARIWDLQTLEEVNHLIGHDGAVSDVDWSPDGTQILTSSLDQTARVWQVEIEGLLDLAESMILRDPPEFTAQERCLYLHECGE